MHRSEFDHLSYVQCFSPPQICSKHVFDKKTRLAIFLTPSIFLGVGDFGSGETCIMRIHQYINFFKQAQCILLWRDKSVMNLCSAVSALPIVCFPFDAFLFFTSECRLSIASAFSISFSNFVWNYVISKKIKKRQVRFFISTMQNIWHCSQDHTCPNSHFLILAYYTLDYDFG